MGPDASEPAIVTAGARRRTRAHASALVRRLGFSALPGAVESGVPRSGLLTLEIRFAAVPAWCDGPLVVGLQEGRADVPCAITPEIGAKLHGVIRLKTGKDGRLDFAGPLVHGRPGERFVYLSWGVNKGDGHRMFRRLKLYLNATRRASWEQPGLTWEDTEAGAVTVTIDGRGPDGTPACGTACAVWRPFMA